MTSQFPRRLCNVPFWNKCFFISPAFWRCYWDMAFTITERGSKTIWRNINFRQWSIPLTQHTDRWVWQMVIGYCCDHNDLHDCTLCVMSCTWDVKWYFTVLTEYTLINSLRKRRRGLLLRWCYIHYLH